MLRRNLLSIIGLILIFAHSSAAAQSKYRGFTVGDEVTGSDVDILGVYNANLVRYWCRPENIRGTETEEQYFSRIDDCLARYDALLTQYEANGIMSIVALDPPTPIYHREDGMPEQRVFVDASAQTQFIEGWRRVAAHFAADPRVLGFDLMNEPASGNVTPGLLDWPELAPLLIQTIRQAGATQRIYVQPEFGNGTRLAEVGTICRAMKKLGDTNIYSSFHFYDPLPYTHQRFGTVPFPTERAFGRYEKIFEKAVARSRGCKGIFLGEFGVSYSAPKREKYIKNIISFAEKFKIDWTFHSYRESEFWNPEVPDVQGRTRVLDVLKARFRRNR